METKIYKIKCIDLNDIDNIITLCIKEILGRWKEFAFVDNPNCIIIRMCDLKSLHGLIRFGRDNRKLWYISCMIMDKLRENGFIVQTCGIKYRKGRRGIAFLICKK